LVVQPTRRRVGGCGRQYRAGQRVQSEIDNPKIGFANSRKEKMIGPDSCSLCVSLSLNLFFGLAFLLCFDFFYLLMTAG
jgi:hypothetical protein